MKRGPERRASRQGLDPLTFWTLFHYLWGKAVGTPTYVKAEWMELQQMANAALHDRRRKQS